MVRKKMEGDETQRRHAARAARDAGTTPSAAGVTTGASKQNHSDPRHDPYHHVERLSDIHRGKGRDESPHPKPGYGEPESKRHRS
ncbi:hypothetical protein [Actinomadura atramentaria]|uniref:hypothetical protein n=1 Tax=Actinomadura atramentaria TaxID=1990 RepID=UPI0003774BEA|nr:hypothetical protein [Actinomadura atramentaria]